MLTLTDTAPLPGAGLETETMPGHWLLARLGKRVLRPGGLELTAQMLEALTIRPADRVVEFAPGLGVTARLALAREPAAYTAIERDEQAARNLGHLLKGPGQQCLAGSADNCPLPAQSASVVYGEAMLTMQGPAQKARIVREAFRLLQPGGRYGLHELCFLPEDVSAEIKDEVRSRLSASIRVGARPLTPGEWRDVLTEAGFDVKEQALAPMHLLEPARLLRDEGLFGASRFVWNLLWDEDARRRVTAMRRVFRKYEAHLAAIMLVATKPVATSAQN